MGSRELETRRARYRIFFLQYLILAGSLAFVTGQAGATHNGNHNPKGPRASLLSSTTCAIQSDGPNSALVVTTTLMDKSSGATVPEVRGGYLGGRYKARGEPGNATQTLGDTLVSSLLTLPAEVNPDLTLSTSFALCDGAQVSAQVLSARELNGVSFVEYGISGGDDENRTVENRCTDDPDTPENEGAIKVADIIDDLAVACAMPM
jgi:hypothetical protein